MKTFYGYPIPDDAHPTRPWWIRYGGGIGEIPQLWKRRDGAWHSAPAAIDKRDPLPAPPPLCGTVFVLPEDGVHRMILAVRGDLFVAIVMNDFRGASGSTLTHSHLQTFHASTLSLALLVSGPGSPWAPPEYEPPALEAAP